MTEQRKRDALYYIECQLSNGYIDLGFHDQDELEVIKEAIRLLKAVDTFNSVGCTSFLLSEEVIQQLKEIVELRPYDNTLDMYLNEFEDEEVQNESILQN
jgi:hypothetical protein